jgi:hypothetical protein
MSENEQIDDRRGHCKVNDKRIQDLEDNHEDLKLALFGKKRDGLTYEFTTMKTRITFLTWIYGIQTAAIIAGVIKLWLK